MVGNVEPSRLTLAYLTGRNGSPARQLRCWIRPMGSIYLTVGKDPTPYGIRTRKTVQSGILSPNSLILFNVIGCHWMSSNVIGMSLGCHRFYSWAYRKSLILFMSFNVIGGQKRIWGCTSHIQRVLSLFTMLSLLRRIRMSSAVIFATLRMFTNCENC